MGMEKIQILIKNAHTTATDNMSLLLFTHNLSIAADYRVILFCLQPCWLEPLHSHTKQYTIYIYIVLSIGLLLVLSMGLPC